MDRVRRQLKLTDHLPAGREEVTVAVLDSGMAMHPDLKNALIAFRDFSGTAGRTGRRFFYQTPYDDYGHGTHVCGILGGSGELSAGRYQGICPGVRLIVGKILDERGNGKAEDMLEGMEWVIKTRERYHTRLLNVSIGIDGLRDPLKKKQMKEMLDRLSKEGILAVCAAGNKGPLPGSLSFLGEGAGRVCVGCHDGNYFRNDPGRCETYSGRGAGAGAVKPDVVAPGTRIRSCSHDYHKGMGSERGYAVKSGTSMATPIVTGCLARVLRMAPDLQNEELLSLLKGTATDLGEPLNKQGFGMVNPRGMMEELRKRE